MTNPINNQVFDSRDLIEYKDHLANELVELFNAINEDFQATDINEIFGTDGYEFADDAKEVFADFEADNEDEIKEYNDLVEFCEELENYCADFNYGVGIIHENYWQEYVQELITDCGYISKDFPQWIEIDWETTANNVSEDYTTVNYDGSTYYAR